MCREYDVRYKYSRPRGGRPEESVSACMRHLGIRVNVGVGGVEIEEDLE